MSPACRSAAGAVTRGGKTGAVTRGGETARELRVYVRRHMRTTAPPHDATHFARKRVTKLKIYKISTGKKVGKELEDRTKTQHEKKTERIWPIVASVPLLLFRGWAPLNVAVLKVTVNGAPAEVADSTDVTALTNRSCCMLPTILSARV